MTLEWNGDSVSEQVDEATRLGLLDAAEFILGESNRIVPLETGDLTRSGFTDSEDGRAVVVYSSVYAVPQHENLDYQHAPGRQAKFLETAANENKGMIPDFIAARIQEELGGTG